MKKVQGGEIKDFLKSDDIRTCTCYDPRCLGPVGVRKFR